VGWPARWRVLGVLCLAVFAINLDSTLVNVTLPTLVRELDASTSQLQWVVDAYNLAFAALVLAAGSLSDRFERKGALVTGLAVFGLGTAVGSLATSTGQLIAARGVMGIGAALVFPNTLSILSNVFTDRAERAKAIGIWGATTGMGVAFGADRRRLAARAVLVGQRFPGDGPGRRRGHRAGDQDRSDLP
jgi:MFS family permease